MAGHVAITRKVSPAIGRCELSHIAREPIDLARAEAQHAAYEQCLAALGCRVESLPAAHDLPDSVFVEDAAIVVDEVAVITRPGAASRRGETTAVADALARFRPLVRLAAPATLDGGDVLRLGRRVLVGASARSNPTGIAQLAAALAPHGYAVEPAPVHGCLHLKSAVTAVAPDAVLLNPDWVDESLFDGLRRLTVHPDEPHAANALLIGETAVFPRAFPRTAERLERAGIRLALVDADELAKAEGAVTCCSLILAV